MDLKNIPTLIFFGLSFILTLTSALNDRPIIGILSQTTYGVKKSYGDAYIAASYVKFVESGGARVVPILVNQPDDYYENMFNSLNGMLFPGGGQNDLLNSGYGKAGRKFYDMAIKNYKASGDYFPLWGGCLGMELLTMLTTNKNLLADTDSFGVSWPIMFTKGFQDSRLYGTADKATITILKTESVTCNSHHKSITLANFSKSAALTDFYRVLSTNLDRKGVRFISTIEAFNYPIYAVQFHPEKNCFEWIPKYVNHSRDAVKICQFFADFFVSEARKSQHKFNSQAEEDASLIYNYSPVYIGNISSFEQGYFFNLNA